MAKYRNYMIQPEAKHPSEVHPIWRGIGCLLIVLTPLIAFSGATLLVNAGVEHNWPIPPEILGHIQFPEWFMNTPVLREIGHWIGSYPNLLAILIAFFLLVLLLWGLFSSLYAMLYRAAGLTRYTELDAPPPRRKAKRYKR